MTTAQRGTLPAMRHLATDPYGAWVTVTWREQRRQTVSGELISITRDLVLVLSDTTWAGIPTSRVQRVVVEPYDGEVETITPYSRMSQSVSPSDLRKVAGYARFPGGMPPGLDRSTLRSRASAVPAAKP